MNESSYSEMLRKLSREYYQSHIDFGEYRKQRKIVLDTIDAEYNGYEILPEPDIHNEEDMSFLSKAIGLFKPNDVDE